MEEPEAGGYTMKQSLCVIIAAALALETASLPRFQFDNGSKSYNQIPHKHQKHRRGRPK